MQSQLHVTNVQLFPVDKDTTLKAMVQITLNNVLKLTGLKLFEGTDSMYLRYPINPKSKKNLCYTFPLDKELRDYIQQEVIEEYDATVY